MYKIRLQRYFFETFNKWANWQGFSVDIRILSTKGCLPLPLGYIHGEKTLKNVYKIRIQRFVWNLQQMVEVIRALCWHKKFVPKGFSALAPGLYTYIKSGHLLTSTFIPKGLSAPALGLYTFVKALKYIPGPGVRWAFIGPLVLWFPLPKISMR